MEIYEQLFSKWDTVIFLKLYMRNYKTISSIFDYYHPLDDQSKILFGYIISNEKTNGNIFFVCIIYVQ